LTFLIGNRIDRDCTRFLSMGKYYLSPLICLIGLYIGKVIEVEFGVLPSNAQSHHNAMKTQNAQDSQHALLAQLAHYVILVLNAQMYAYKIIPVHK